MSKCISTYFILNDKLKSCKYFNEQLTATGKNLYTVIRIIKGIPLFWELHYKRLLESSKKAAFDISLSESNIKQRIDKLIKSNNFIEGNIKVVFNFNDKDEMNFIAYYIPHHYPDKNLYKNGIATLTLDAERENPNIKFINKDLRETTNKLISINNVYEIILVDKDGFITEGSRSNIFMIKNDNILTPPLNSVLPGITRMLIFQICTSLNIKIIEKKIHVSQLNEFDGIFISGTSPKILPIQKINNHRFTSENIILHQIMQEYDKLIDDYINTKKNLKKE